MKNISEKDKKFVWHPLTQHKRNPEMLPIARAEGCLLYDMEGKPYIDGISSWYTSMYGHCNPRITSRVAEQMTTLDQVVFSGFTHAPAVQLAEELLEVLPGNQSKIFYSDNGSTSVEIGIKMALQYHFNRGEKRPVLLAFEDGFHGDTFGAMSVSGLSVYNGPFEDFFLKVERLPVPTAENLQQILEWLENRLKTKDIACFVYEPLVQGAAAMKMHKAEHLQPLLALLQQEGVVTVADEVMTGFGKTGKYFASLYMETKPDIICLSKALTAGLLPMAATSCSQQIYDAFYSDELGKGFFHGHTYTANPLACTAALAALQLLRSGEIQRDIDRIVNSHRNFASEIESHSRVANVRQCGVILALDLDVSMERYGNLRDRLYKHFMDQGVFLRPLGNTIYILAPYVITVQQLTTVYDSIRTALDLF
ncbi:adenosylmethionine--8-amino-7-oxononanoate transaminase [Zeaxanthinibacter sp. PT1]|uniref:adenosylmethionine--8-amino-7-oxononanoate transaminase n=1 Tax=Zeaxanthinibacter TaxID=561554 RepID=UPI00234A918A|nr:adenosylmethionine--8-amino-7-oxononanoate transaminase [Zeaxanthinibacter sp. PT1]MDC6351064.1 adenosylmethionine--8-amino-7-oxononanoate transaminase [Zeaxanthinibacter sp. PT1]